jgi:rhamnulokinase
MGTKQLSMLAVDFGASSGRTIWGAFTGSKLSVQEIHRFANDPVQLGGSLHWDFLRLFHELKKGLHAYKEQATSDPASIAVDTWGVDYGLVDGSGHLMGNPYHYRDARTNTAMESCFKTIPKKELFLLTGIQPLQFNTIFQLLAWEQSRIHPLGEDVRLLFTPDLFHYYLSGVKATEYTIASTSGLLDPVQRNWNRALLDRLPFAQSLFTDIVMPGTILGGLRRELTEELGIGSVPVIASASHDTASAVVSIPTLSNHVAFISCGTWSLMGVETDQPIINEWSERWSFTNEGGAEQKIRLLKNIMGLWLLQECKRHWEQAGESLTFAEMQEMARLETASVSYVDPEDPVFLAPGNMPERIRSYCQQTGQQVPQTKSAMIRCVTESLAMKFKQTLDEIEFLLDRKLEPIHMVGGGIQNKLLCQLTANVLGRTVIAGPVEATAIGNLMMQAKAHGEVSGLQDIRQVVIDSFPPEVYEPQEREQWEQAYQTYKQKLNIQSE